MLPLDMVAAILDSLQEAVEVTDSHGNIIYVNPAFRRITGIPFEIRTNQNIFAISPDGALALALKTGKPVSGYRTKVGGSNAEVISNAVPVVVNNETLGAVVIFQHITDIIKLAEEVKRSSTLLRDLSDKFGQVTQSKYKFDHITGQSLNADAAKSTSGMINLLPLDEMEKIMIQRALEKFGSSLEGKKEAALALRISLATLYNKIKKYKI
ncbi:MAG: PAS domain-containing protein [Bacillota bacterium]|nr:PAS domain S-box protein [Bacillota bacterium]